MALINNTYVADILDDNKDNNVINNIKYNKSRLEHFDNFLDDNSLNIIIFLLIIIAIFYPILFFY